MCNLSTAPHPHPPAHSLSGEVIPPAVSAHSMLAPRKKPVQAAEKKRKGPLSDEPPGVVLRLGGAARAAAAATTTAVAAPLAAAAAKSASAAPAAAVAAAAESARAAVGSAKAGVVAGSTEAAGGRREGLGRPGPRAAVLVLAFRRLGNLGAAWSGISHGRGRCLTLRPHVRRSSGMTVAVSWAVAARSPPPASSVAFPEVAASRAKAAAAAGAAAVAKRCQNRRGEGVRVRVRALALALIRKMMRLVRQSCPAILLPSRKILPRMARGRHRRR